MDDDKLTLTPTGLISHTLALRAQDRAGELAALRFGLIQATELRARQYTDRFLESENDLGASGWRRAAAICAASTGSAQAAPGSILPVGGSLRLLYHKENPAPAINPANAIVTQVNSLPLLDLENAARILALLIGRCSSHHIPVDFYDLGRTLSRWGGGATAKSQYVRQRHISDFYRFNNGHNSKDSNL